MIMCWAMKNGVGIPLRCTAHTSSTIRCVLNWFKTRRNGCSLALLFPVIRTLIQGPMIFGKPFGNCTQASVTRTPNERSHAALLCNPRRKEGALGPVSGKPEALQPAEAVFGRNRIRREPLRQAKVTVRRAPPYIGDYRVGGDARCDIGAAMKWTSRARLLVSCSESG